MAAALRTAKWEQRARAGETGLHWTPTGRDMFNRRRRVCDKRKENTRFGEGRDLTAIICGHVSTLVAMCSKEDSRWSQRGYRLGQLGPIVWSGPLAEFHLIISM